MLQVHDDRRVIVDRRRLCARRRIAAFARYLVRAVNRADRAAGLTIAELADTLRPAICTGLENLRTLPGGEYILLAADRPSGQARPGVTVHLIFGEDLFDELNAGHCRVDGDLLIEALVHELRMTPELDAIERSGVMPIFDLDGKIASVQRG
jgi:hypothetical protein